MIKIVFIDTPNDNFYRKSGFSVTEKQFMNVSI